MNILFVENHPHFGKTVREKFLSEHNVEIVPGVQLAIEALKINEFDCALVDYDLDDGKGDELVSYLSKSNNPIPCIAVSSHERGNNAIINAGAKAVCPKMEFGKIGVFLNEILND